MKGDLIMILAILQARTSSTRLPGKVLKQILDEPMMFRQIERIQHSSRIDKIVVATSNDQSDDVIEIECKARGVEYYRGSLDNVLDRFYETAKIYKPDHIVRLTADCPLIDSDIIDDIIEYHLKESNDYTSNTVEPTFPDGLDVEIFKYQSIVDAWKEAQLTSQKEHVTPFIYQQGERYKLGIFKNVIDLSDLRWTVDEEMDFQLITHIYNALYPIYGSEFKIKEILNYLNENLNLLNLNNNYKRNEGYRKSLLHDKI